MLISTPGGQVLQAKNLLTLRNQAGPTEIQRKNQERIIRVTAEPEGTLSEASTPSTRGSARSACRRTSRSASAPRPRSRRGRSRSCR